MAKRFRYLVSATCKATVTENWTLLSPLPLTDDEIRTVLEEGAPEDGSMDLSCTEEETSDEEDRVVDEIDFDGEVEG
jgi:hypothetical protein